MLDFVHFCTPSAGRGTLMRNFNSQEGMFKPILRIKIAPEGLPFQQSGGKDVQSRAMLLILGSQSPRRKEILSYFSLPFVQIASNFDEESLPFEGDPVRYTTELASRKAADLAIRFPAETIVAADTVVFFEGKVFNKPKNEEEGASMLRAFAGKWQEVYTGVAVRSGKQLHTGWEMTRILFNPLTEKQIHLYMQSCSYLDKAGGYAIMRQGGLLIAKIDGSYDNVMGLPINTLGRLLGLVGIDLWAHLKSDYQ